MAPSFPIKRPRKIYCPLHQMIMPPSQGAVQASLRSHSSRPSSGVATGLAGRSAHLS